MTYAARRYIDVVDGGGVEIDGVESFAGPVQDLQLIN